MNAHKRAQEFTDALPCSLEAEQALLGAVLLNPDTWYAVTEIVEAEHFIEQLHQRLWSVICERMTSGQGVAIIPLVAALGKDASVEIAKGTTVSQYIARLAAEGTSVLGHADYANTIRDLWRRRKLVMLGRDLQQRANGGFEDEGIDALLDDADSELGTIRFGRGVGGSVTIGHAAAEVLQDISDAHASDTKPGFETGIVTLDNLLGPIMPGNLITLVGPSMHGKTGLAAQILCHNAAASLDTQRVITSAFFSQEMKATEIASRIMASRTGISVVRQKRGDVSDGDYQALVEAAKQLRAMPVHLDGTGRQRVSRIVTKLRGMKKRYGIQLAAVDHLLLLSPEGPRIGKIETIENAVMVLKDIAKELDIAIILLAQVTREGQKRDKWRVRSSDIYGGDMVKQCSDAVLSIVVPPLWLREHEPDIEGSKEHDQWQKDLNNWKGKAEIGALKIRDGESGGYRKLSFDGRRVCFGECE